MKGLKKVFHANGKKKETRAVVLKSDKINFNTKTVKRDKESHCEIKCSIQQENVTIVMFMQSMPEFLAI